MASKLSSDEIISIVGLIRTANNALWMDILKLAFRVGPDEARAIMDKIRSNDLEIIKWLGKL